MVRAALELLRSDPEAGRRPEWQRYEVELPDGSTVLEALMAVQDEQDGTIAFRRACRHAICGSCAMRVNGCARLACNTQVSLVAAQAAEMVAARGGDPATAAIRVEPLGNMPVVKDLVTDMDVFWRKIRRTRPWLFPADLHPDPDSERLVSPQEWDVMAQGLLCLECGSCYSDCAAVAAAPEFIGPTALVKAHRYATDTRDIDVHRRMTDLSDEHGLWECMRCYFCSERCPKHIRVRDLIAQLGEIAWREGLRQDPGARHAEAFVRSIRNTGRLDETTLSVRSQGWIWSARRLPLAVRIAAAGKLALTADQVDDHEKLLRVIAEVQRLEREAWGAAASPPPPSAPEPPSAPTPSSAPETTGDVS